MVGSIEEARGVLLKRWDWRQKHKGRVSYPGKSFDDNKSLRDRVIGPCLQLAAKNFHDKQAESLKLYEKRESLLNDLHNDPDNKKLKRYLEEADRTFGEKRDAIESAIDDFRYQWKFYARYPHCLDPAWGNSHQFLNADELTEPRGAHQSIFAKS